MLPHSQKDCVQLDLQLSFRRFTFSITSNFKLVERPEGVTGDMRLYHDTSNSFIDDNGTGNLQLVKEQELICLRGASDEDMVIYKRWLLNFIMTEVKN